MKETELLKVINDIDFFLIDIKDMNETIYETYTGKKPDLMQHNLKLLAERGLQGKVTIRLPLIDGFNTEEDRVKSEKALKRKGFASFDRFSYVVKKALEKRQKLVLD